MQSTPRGLRLHIGIFGRRNVGKSSLLNALTRQQVAIVADFAGTTTDPVEKAMELEPLGPVLFIDTAGVDDEGELGARRVARTEAVFARTDVGLVVAGAAGWDRHEEAVVAALRARGAGVVAVFNQSDRRRPDPELVRALAARGVQAVTTVATRGEGVGALREALVRAAPEESLGPRGVLDGVVTPGDLALLVAPLDIAAPKGRLILPQVQTIRAALDKDATCMVVKERDLRASLARLREPPALVVTDSQAFARVDAETPRAVAMTSFSILFARFKGDLPALVEGALALDALRPGDRVLVAEACTHHPTRDDIGRVKIPRWLAAHAGGPLDVVHVQGRDFPDDLTPYRMVIQCGACVLGRREVLGRIARCRQQGVPISNYGVTIARLLGILPRALEPFTEVRGLCSRLGAGGHERAACGG